MGHAVRPSRSFSRLTAICQANLLVNEIRESEFGGAPIKGKLLELARLTDLSMCRTGELNGFGRIVSDIASFLSECRPGFRAELIEFLTSEPHEGPLSRLVGCLLQCDSLSAPAREVMKNNWLNRPARFPSCAF